MCRKSCQYKSKFGCLTRFEPVDENSDVNIENFVTACLELTAILGENLFALFTQIADSTQSLS